jgi:hypothetical protein
MGLSHGNNVNSAQIQIKCKLINQVLLRWRPNLRRESNAQDWIWRMPPLQQPLLGMTTSQSWQPRTPKSPRAANVQNEMWDELWLLHIVKDIVVVKLFSSIHPSRHPSNIFSSICPSHHPSNIFSSIHLSRHLSMDGIIQGRKPWQK